VNQFGWNVEKENQASILHRSLGSYHVWRQSLLEYDWEPPTELDPREWNVAWNQGQMGSCQGVSLAEAASMCWTLARGTEAKFSGAWGYLASQAMSGLIGKDQGSTLDGGSKAASQLGMVLEEDFPYSDQYGAILRKYQSDYDALVAKAKDFKLRTEVPLGNYDEIYHFLASGVGPVHIGILWGLPDAWEITRYSSSGGGHSALLIGYLKVTAWPKPALLLRNSWGTGWGRDGYAIVHPDAVEAMCRGKWNVFVGRSDMESPRPRPIADI
jgi:C1A family cysteine protease